MHDASQQRVITSSTEFDDLCKQIAAEKRLAFDAECVRQHSYQPEVCVVRVATDSFQAIVDPLAGLDIRPFWELVADPSIETIVHAGSEDLALCWKTLGRPPAAIVDLQVSAGFMGLGYPT